MRNELDTFTSAPIEELREREYPRADTEAAGISINEKDDIPAEKKEEVEAERKRMVDALDSYFSIFIDPGEVRNEDGQQICVGCGTVLTPSSAIDQALGLASFEWAITHGEGRCSKCGYPSRAYHNISKLEEIDIEGTLNAIMQYHPDELEIKDDPDGDPSTD